MPCHSERVARSRRHQERREREKREREREKRAAAAAGAVNPFTDEGNHPSNRAASNDLVRLNLHLYASLFHLLDI